MVKISMRHSCNTSVVRQCARHNALDSAVSAAQPSRPGTGERCSFLDGSSPRETTQQHNTHITDVREICYSGHPWHGRAVRVHASLVKRGHAVAYCSLEDAPACRALEIPVWSKNPIYMKSNDDGGRGPSYDVAPPVTLTGA